MKRFIALFLILSTLLCAFPMGAVLAAETEASASEEAAGGSYVDLYVKEGLLALFAAYDAKEADGAAASWTPVDLYGKDGYEDYLASAAYTLAKPSKMGWKWGDGYLSSYSTSANTTKTTADFYLKLDSIGTTLASSPYTVQNVYQLTGPLAGAIPTYDIDENGDYIVNNYSSLATGGQYATSKYGLISLRSTVYSNAVKSNNNVHNATFMQLSYSNAKYEASTLNVFFINSHYLRSLTSRYFYRWVAGTDADGNPTQTKTIFTVKSGSNYKAYSDTYPTALYEQTVSRTTAGNIPYAYTDAAGTESTRYQASYTFTWQFAPNRYGGTPLNGARSFSGTFYGTSDAKTLRVGVGVGRNYSVRVYNTVLTSDEINQNHLADLCGYYGIDASSLIALDKEQLVAVANAVADVKLSRDNDDAAAMAAAKQELESRLYEAIAATMGDATYSYLDLYVKDGLVALFDAYGSSSSNAAPTTWTPVNFCGKTGYDAYLAPKAYALAGTWSAKDGAYGTKTDACLRLASLVEAMGTALDTAYPNYTVQEVFGVTAAPTINAIYTKDEAGDWIIENYDALTKKDTANAYSTYGAIRMCYSFYTYCQKPSGKNYFINNYLFQMQYHNGNGYTYKRNAVLTNDYYGGEKAVYYYMADGVKTALASGASIYAGRFPSNVWEQTVTRSLDTAKTTAESIVFDNKVSWQFVPGALNSGSYTGRGFAYETTNAADLDYDVLTVFSGKNANVYSLRVYNRVITENEMDQNHLADLCGFYGISVAPLSVVMADKVAALAAEYAGIKLLPTKTDENGNVTDEYIAVKNKLQLAINAMAQEELNGMETAQQSLMAFDGYSFRVSGKYGIRALFSLDKLSEERLAKKNVEVAAFGAITAIGNYQGTEYNKLEDLTLSVAEDGTLSLADGVRGAAFVASTDAGFKTLSEDENAVRFAYTATYPVDGGRALFTIDMLYRGYAVLRDGAGEYSVLYYDIPEEKVLSSLYDLHVDVTDDYGIYKDSLGIGATFDYLYDVLTAVDPVLHDETARETARNLANDYGFDTDSITLTFGAFSDVHVVNAARGNRMANMMKVFQKTYDVDAILFAGDITDKLNGSDYATDAGFLKGYQELGYFAEYAAEGNIYGVPLVWTLGNHERPHMINENAVTFTTGKNHVAYTIPAGTTVTEGFYKVMEASTDTFMDPTDGAPTGFRRQEIAGYAFYAIDYTFANAETIEWLDAQLTADEKANPDQPIFVTSHMPSTHSAQMDCITECIQKHGNVIYFSGHTHVQMQTYSSITERDGFLEVVLGPGSHGNYGVSGSGYSYNSYEMKQGAVIDVDVNGNVRVRCVDMNYDVAEDGSITTLFTKGGNDDLGTIANNPYVLRTAYFSHPSSDDRMHVLYDSIPRYTTDARYEAPAFAEDAVVGVGDVSEVGLNVLIPKASATNVIKYYKLTLTDSKGNAVNIYDPLKKANVSVLTIGSDHICYVPYNENYPDTYVYKLSGGKTTTEVTVTEDDPTTDVDETVTEKVTTYALVAGESYTVTVVAYDDFGTETHAISATFTVPEV